MDELENIEPEVNEDYSDFSGDDFVVNPDYDEEVIESYDDESTDDNEDPIEAQGEEFIDWEYPEFISDDFVVPETFKSPKEELSWYKDKYLDLMDTYRSEEFTEKLVAQHEKILLENEDKIERFKAFEAMAQGDPTLAMKIYSPQYLATNNIDYKVTDEQKIQFIDNRLAKEFGKNYRNAYDPNEAADPDTLSGKMYAKQIELQNYLDNVAQAAEDKVQEVIPPSKEQIIEQEYLGFEHAMSKEDFVDFVEESTKYYEENPMTFKDIYLLRNIDEIAEEIFQNGLEQGRLSAGDTFKGYGQSVYNDEPNYDAEDEITEIYNSHDVYNHLRGR